MSELNKSGSENAWAVESSGDVPASLSRNVRQARGRRALALAIPIAVLSLVTGCGSDSKTPASTPAPSSPAAGASEGGAGTSNLTGDVGEGDAFVITLKDSTGAPVTTLKAGKYEVKVKDASKIHNFHLTGPGVEEKTTVPEVTDKTWTVTLAAGTYTYKCDPHAKMTGSFTVT
ncbi:MAG: hypothetical protein QOE58_3436 [Actinomycetota bacterium]|jgi:plastocyanin|nr:hypothetical protein [Actinomycetota bacterium]